MSLQAEARFLIKNFARCACELVLEVVAVLLATRSGIRDAAAFVSGAGAHVDDPVASRGDVHVVLHDDHGVSGFDQRVSALS